jgi:hypothetical protein
MLSDGRSNTASAHVVFMEGRWSKGVSKAGTAKIATMALS